MAQEKQSQREKIQNKIKKRIQKSKAPSYKKPIIIALLVIAVLIGLYNYMESLAYKTVRVEAGVSVKASDFMKEVDEKAYFTEKSEAFDVTVPGEYHVLVKSGWYTHKCTLIIQDTVAPTADAKSVQLLSGETCEASDLVENVYDVTKLDISFVEAPDFGKAGNQYVSVLIKDAGNNQIIVNSKITIKKALDEVNVEAGSVAPSVEEFTINATDAKFMTDMEAIDYTQTGDHPVVVLVDGSSYVVTMHIVDTTAPSLEVTDYEAFVNTPRKAEDFVVSAQDYSPIEFSFATEPDLTKIGTQDVEIKATDSFGNAITKIAKLTLIEDNEPPVIVGAKDFYIFIGSPISYKKNVVAKDNAPEGAILSVDASAVNTDVEGDYPVIYTATDYSGNESSVTVTVFVRVQTYSEDEVNALADAVLAKILKPEMSEYEKLQAIFKYIKSHVAYINHSEKGNWVRAAYEGLVDGRGDCYVFACISKVLLTRAGITNMDIAKIPARTQHFWNLVDIGDGWYHFDTCPRSDHPTIFYWTDAQLMEYSNSHNLSHNYDHDLYPVVN